MIKRILKLNDTLNQNALDLDVEIKTGLKNIKKQALEFEQILARDLQYLIQSIKTFFKG